jgi:Ca2+-transporting ATPase
MMTTIHSHNGQKISFAKGAPEVMLKLCSKIQLNGKVRKLDGKEKRKILDANKEFADHALRVLGFAYKKLDSKDKNPEKNLVFIGLQAMMDPPRSEVKQAIEKCKKAGIKVIMITGDHEITAKAVAKEIGLEGRSISGKELDEIKNLEEIVDDISIFARVNPEHKLKIVDALKKKGHIVAMTGDGVNDAPALKKADIGIAMGISGTDVSKEASAMILTDDNFASIVNAVEEGRGIYDNIKKYFAFLVSGNIAKVLLIFFSIILGLPLPLTATQILLINLVTDGLPAIALAADPFEPNAMSRKPRKQNEPIYRKLRIFLIYFSMMMLAVSFAVFGYVYFTTKDVIKAQTMTFLTVVMFQVYSAFTCRSIRYNAYKVGIFKNKWLVVSVLISFLVASSLIFIPAMQKIFVTTSLTFFEFLFICLIASSGAIVVEFMKWIKTRKEIIEVYD